MCLRHALSQLREGRDTEALRGQGNKKKEKKRKEKACLLQPGEAATNAWSVLMLNMGVL